MSRVRPNNRRPERSQAISRLPDCRPLSCTLVLAILSGCASYSERMTAATTDADAGRYEEAIDQVQKASGLNGNGIPKELDSDAALGLLNRATLEQALQRFGPSSQDFQEADRELEFLDIANDAVGELGRYFFSDSATRYRSSPTEKLALNGFNMMNYLALNDLQGARVESRRFSVMQRYLNEYAKGQPHAAFGSYLAGFTLEQMGEYTGAMRYYDEALAIEHFESLREPVRRLSTLTPYRGQAIAEFLADPKPLSVPESAINSEATARILVVISVGRVPHKVPERIPIGAAIGLAGSAISGDPAVLGYSVFKFVVYPGLAQTGSRYSQVRLRVDGQDVRPDLASRLGAEISREYESIKPSIIAAAVSRMIVRAAAAEGMREAGNSAGDGLGWFLALATEASLAGLDKPDTRSWMFLPDRVYVYQQRVTPGKHRVEVLLGTGPSESYVEEISVAEGGFAAVVVTAPR